MEKILQLVEKETRLITPANHAAYGYLPAAALLTAVVLWGGSFVAMRMAVTVLSPMAVMWCRMMIALLLIIPFYKKLIPANYQAGDWKILLPMVLFQPCFYFLLESNALQLTTSSQAGVISAFVPILVTIGAAMFLAERISILSLAGLTLSISGVFFLTLLAEPQGPGQNPLAGNALEFCAMICAAGNMLIIKKLSNRYNPWCLTAMQILAGAIFFLPGSFHLLQASTDVWTNELVFALFFLGAFVTFGAFGLYNWGISRIPAARASAFINLVPVVAVILGWVILSEALSFKQCLAAVAVMAGVMLSQKPG